MPTKTLAASAERVPADKLPKPTGPPGQQLGGLRQATPKASTLIEGGAEKLLETLVVDPALFQTLNLNVGERVEVLL
jgi:hypothetical protein